MFLRHGQYINSSKNGSTEIQAWFRMHRRCYDPKFPPYKYYGARGIQVCDRWNKNKRADAFSNFLSDMGLRPSDKSSLGRINNNLSYAPDNCRWETWKEQAQNRRPVPRGSNGRFISP